MQPNQTSPPALPETSRRQFLAQSGATIAGVALAGGALPQVHVAGSDTVQLALIGSGNRGSGAVANAMEATGSTVKLVAMADLYENRLHSAHTALGNKFKARVDVP